MSEMILKTLDLLLLRSTTLRLRKVQLNITSFSFFSGEVKM